MSNIQELIASNIHSGESETFAYSPVLPPPQTVARIIASMANTNGGLFVLGLHNRNNKIEPVGISSDFYANDITTKAAGLLNNEITIQSRYITFKEKRIFIIEVEKSSTPILLNGVVYTRLNNQITSGVTAGSQQARMPKVDLLFDQCEQYKISSTGSKKNLLDHYQSILNILSDLSERLAGNTPPANGENNILKRILFSSCVDNFEIYLSNLLYEIFLAKPETLSSGENTVTVKEVLACSDIQEFIQYISRKKLSKLSRGSVKGFLSENKQIAQLGVLTDDVVDEIDKIFQIRHLYAHRNGVVDEKFLATFSGSYQLHDEHVLTLEEFLDFCLLLLKIAHQLDKTAINKYHLSVL